MASLQQSTKSATACGSTGTCRSPWMTASCCAPMCSARSSTRASIRSSSPTAPTPRASRSRTAIRARGSAWRKSIRTSPRARRNLYQSWEVVDPEKWVPHDYACVRVDSRGAGCSPGFIDHFSPRETKDFYDCIEWAGVQPWSNGKVGLNGISYYGINQWHVASLQPPHLAAMCVWEGAADWYRDMTHHGGILSTFWENWYDMQVKTVQYGAGERGKRSRVHGELVCGPETLTRGRARQKPLRLRRRDPRPSARRRLPQGALAEVGQDHRAAVLGGELGRPGPASARQFRRLRSRRRRSTNGSKRTASSTGRTSTPTTAASSSCVSSTISCTARSTAGRSSRRCCCRSAIRARNSCERARTNGRSRAPNGPSSISIRRDRTLDAPKRPSGRRASSTFDAMGDGLTLPHAAARKGDRDHRPVGAQAVRIVVDPRRRPVHRAACLHRRPEGDRVPGRDRSAHADRARLAARLASQARQEIVASRTGPITPTMRNSRSRRGKRSNSTSRSGRPRSWCRPAIAWRCRCAARTTSMAAAAAAGCRTSKTS